MRKGHLHTEWKEDSLPAHPHCDREPVQQGYRKCLLGFLPERHVSYLEVIDVLPYFIKLRYFLEFGLSCSGFFVSDYNTRK